MLGNVTTKHRINNVKNKEARNGKRDEHNPQKHENIETLIRKTKKNIIFMP